MNLVEHHFIFPYFLIHTINPTKLFSIRKVGFKPTEFTLLYAVELKLFAENVMIYSVKGLFEVNER